MSANVHIEGTANRVSIYRIDDLQIEGIESENYDLQDREDLERYMETIDALVESAELDLLENGRSVVSLDPEGIEEFTLSSDESHEESLSLDALQLFNRSILEPLKSISEAEEGAIFYLRSESGEGFWDLSLETEENVDPAKLSMGYFDCSESLDTYDLLRESYFDVLCDTVLPSDLHFAEETFTQERFDFKPGLIQGSLYRVAVDATTGEPLLERLPCPPKIFLDESEEIV